MSKTLLMIEKTKGTLIAHLKKAKQYGYKIILMSSNNYEFNKITDDELQLIDLFVEIDTNDFKKVIDKAIEINTYFPINGVISYLEYSSPIVARVAKALNLPGVSIDAADNARNKFLTREKFKHNGVPSPQYYLVQTFDEAKNAATLLGYPNIIKPIDLAASRNVLKNSDLNSLRKNYSTISSFNKHPYGAKIADTYLMEEYIIGQEYSVEAISFDEKNEIICITKKETGGEYTFVELEHTVSNDIEFHVKNILCEVVRQALESLGIKYGITHTEVKITPDGPKIIEVNNRVAGGKIPELVELALGINLWSIAYSLALGEIPDFLPQKDAASTIRYFTAPKGKIKEIQGIEDAKQVKGVCSLVVNAKIGDKHGELLNGSNRDLGYVIAMADNSAKSQEIANEVVEKINFIMDIE